MISARWGESFWLDTVTCFQNLPALQQLEGRATCGSAPAVKNMHTEHAASWVYTSTGTPAQGTPPCGAAGTLTCLVPYPTDFNLTSLHTFPHPRTSMRALIHGRGEPPALATSTPPPTAARACPPPSPGPPTTSTAQVRIPAGAPGWAKSRPPSRAGITKLSPASAMGPS